ncbi:hypothetical protein [Pseudomonas sp. PDM27]|uniref:hypothetical protein n=1 Tax=Pseudomonas sp. PDM27 TaxID=2854769 RepID=UPI001C454BC6|nr:hypothetical protein [Pseudomonas sp. PDM27]MBV7569558.1 hypothetical protein [Pseudomonas sp. PDM27]
MKFLNMMRNFLLAVFRRLFYGDDDGRNRMSGQETKEFYGGLFHEFLDLVWRNPSDTHKTLRRTFVLGFVVFVVFGESRGLSHFTSIGVALIGSFINLLIGFFVLSYLCSHIAKGRGVTDYDGYLEESLKYSNRTSVRKITTTVIVGLMGLIPLVALVWLDRLLQGG